MAAVGGGLAGNAFWLRDWLRYWWIRVPLQTGTGILPHRTFQTLWSAPLWGDPTDRILAFLLLGAGLVGVVLLNQKRQRAAARLLGLGAAGFLGLALVGVSWEPMSQLGTAHLLTPALLFSSVPAAHAVATVLHELGRRVGSLGRSGLVVATILLVAVLGDRDQAAALAQRYTRTEPLALGPGPETTTMLQAIQSHTTAQARILWEDRPEQGSTQHWTALLPILSADASGSRCFLGGLDPGATIEHAFASFSDQALAGRHISRWRDEELHDFCRRYNVGWVVCWSAPALNRFRAWSEALPVEPLGDGGRGCLFAIQRPHSFALKGQATWLRADCEQVSLANVIPEDGQLVLSLHYQEGLRASPSRVRVERELDPYDPIPFVRLRVPDPVTRVTLTWENR
jgi:hypothetical protein